MRTLEDLGLSRASSAFGAAFRGRSVLVTGHTGFKGSWLCLWLSQLGARVHGYALPPEVPLTGYEVARVEELLASSTLADIRDEGALERAFASAGPEVVFHLAAQPLVREGYLRPRDTFDVNGMGTVAVLECVRRRARPCVVVVVTSDKCYAQRPGSERHREEDRLGGYDPYSASKAVAELVTDAYRSSFFAVDSFEQHGVALASARAGNVIGGGDRAADRIVVDVLAGLELGKPVHVRNPAAVRPWQHVLEPLSGYLRLAQKLLVAPDADLCSSFNFGPLPADERPVCELVELLHSRWGAGEVIEARAPGAPYEAPVLRLAIDRAAKRLQWYPVWRLEQAIEHTVAWQRALASGEVDMQRFSSDQIAAFESTASRSW